MEKAYYSVVRYLPDPLRGEVVNVGVIVTTERGEFVGARFDRDPARVRCLASGEPYDNVRTLADEFETRGAPEQLFMPVEGIARWNLNALDAIHRNWGNSIQFTEPRVALETEPARLLEQVYARYVDRQQPAKQRSRDKRAVLSQVVPRLHSALDARHPGAIRTGASVTGRVEQHAFDVVLHRGAAASPIHAAEALSFVTESPRELSKAVAATAWALDDVRKVFRPTELALSVLVLERDNSSELDRMGRICQEFDAQLVRSGDLDRWVDRAAEAFTLQRSA